jgi:replicative DNA helicase
MYQLSQRERGERDDDYANEMIHLLNDLRVRFGFALVLEDHAPLGPAGEPRKMRPFGSSIWQRWPDFGVGLNVEKGHFVVDMFRGKRLRREWPDEFHRGGAQGWPWTPYYKTRGAAAAANPRQARQAPSPPRRGDDDPEF